MPAPGCCDSRIIAFLDLRGILLKLLEQSDYVRIISDLVLLGIRRAAAYQGR